MLDVVGDVAQIRDREHRRADDVFIVDKGAVFRVVRVAFCAEAEGGRIVFIGDDTDDAVRRHGIFVEHERDDLAGFDFDGIDLFDVNQRAGVIGRFHRAGQHGEHPEAYDAGADQQDGKHDRQRDANGAERVENFTDGTVHRQPADPLCLNLANAADFI